ncbi:MAG TPA: SMC-Scp complex subunit ScpB [Pirellulales bacterium]|jgi:segregation and condensation protein B|nr:SMC-Scp complex subunit ScpB [Pirellulales bacterium]
MANSTDKSQPAAQGESSGMSLDQLSQAFAAMLGPSSQSSGTPLVVAGDPVLAADTNEVAQNRAQPDSPVPAEATPDDAFPITPRAILEAMLFVGRPDNLPLTSEQMAGLMRGVTAEEIDALICDLNAQYLANGAPYTIASQGAGYRLVLEREFGPVQERMLGRTRATRLSPVAIEVLAMVAYNEPLTAAEVNRLRGAPSGHVLRHLVRRRLLRLERGEGKPSQAKYFTTPRFLEVFRLQSLADLPRSDDLAKH